MKFDSENIQIEISPEYKVLYGVTEEQKNFEIWDDGDIVFEADGHDLILSYLEMEEIVRAYKVFIDRRTVLLSKQTNN